MVKVASFIVPLTLAILLGGELAYAKTSPNQSNAPNDLEGVQTQQQGLPDKPVPHASPAPSIHLAEFAKGKGAFLFYSFSATSPIYWENFSPAAVINQAKEAGLKYLEIRVGYSNWLQIVPGPQQLWFNQILDLARTHGIHVIGWVVPFTDNRSAMTIQSSLNGDWQVAYQISHYKTPTGAHVSGLAMDLELGPLYFGGNTTALIHYVQGVRSLMGPGYPLISIVPDPARTGLTATLGKSNYYPYNRLTPLTNVFQPMAYWHEYYTSANFNYSNSYVQTFMQQAVSSTKFQAGNSKIPVNAALQAFGNPTVGYPSVNEVSTALSSANAAGAIGASAFQWHTLTASYWQVLSQYLWHKGN